MIENVALTRENTVLSFKLLINMTRKKRFRNLGTINAILKSKLQHWETNCFKCLYIRTGTKDKGNCHSIYRIGSIKLVALVVGS